MHIHIVAHGCCRQFYNTPQEKNNLSCCVMQFTDIQGSLEAAPSTRSDDTPEEHPPGGSLLTLSPEASSAPPQGEASQGSLGAALGDEQKKKSRREWQQSLRSSNKFKSADATRGPWGLSVHSPRTERRSAQLLHNSNNAASPFLGLLGFSANQHPCQRQVPSVHWQHRFSSYMVLPLHCLHPYI